MTIEVAPLAPARRLLTIEDFYRMDDAGIFQPDERLELIEGELFVVAAMGSEHAVCTYRTGQWFRSRLPAHTILREEKPVRLPPRSEPLPDIAIVRHHDDLYLSAHPGPADLILIIEVADTTLAYDRGRKLAMYAGAGITVYWVADLRGRRLFVHRQPEQRAYRDVTDMREGSLSPLAFSEIVMSLDDIFGVVANQP